MRHANNEKRETIYGGRNGATKSRKIRTLREKEAYKNWGILEADTIKRGKMKEKFKKEYLRRTEKQLETKLNRRNLIKVINTWAAHLVR